MWEERACEEDHRAPVPHLDEQVDNKLLKELRSRFLDRLENVVSESPPGASRRPPATPPSASPQYWGRLDLRRQLAENAPGEAGDAPG